MVRVPDSSNGKGETLTMKIMGMTMRTEYKVTNGVFGKRKVRLCARGDQQIEGLLIRQSTCGIFTRRSSSLLKSV